ncbi:MAG TPA: hydrogenase maturation protease [Candidatus Binataceae bacterium]|nr:hydrogenase maturation protease [Candidatus Binataceae bacterium]
MTRRARIIGVGNPMAGDDGVGIEVVRAIARTGANDGVDLSELADPSRLVELLTDGADPVVIIDALLDSHSPGRVMRISQSSAKDERLLSTHGLGIFEAIELARATYPDRIAPHIEIVAIAVSGANRTGAALSPEIAALVPHAAREALRLARSIP